MTATSSGRRAAMNARGSPNSRSRARMNRTTAQFSPASYAPRLTPPLMVSAN